MLHRSVPGVGSNNVAVIVVGCPVRTIRVTATKEVGGGTNVLILERRSVEHCVTTNSHLILIVKPLGCIIKELSCTDRIPPTLDTVLYSLSGVAFEIGAIPSAYTNGQFVSSKVGLGNSVGIRKLTLLIRSIARPK